MPRAPMTVLVGNVYKNESIVTKRAFAKSHIAHAKSCEIMCIRGHKKTRSSRAGFRGTRTGALYFSASKTRARISSTVPRPEILRYSGAFRPLAAPFFAQSL